MGSPTIRPLPEPMAALPYLPLPLPKVPVIRAHRRCSGSRFRTGIGEAAPNVGIATTKPVEGGCTTVHMTHCLL